MKTVYVCEHNIYGICGIFSNEELANCFINTFTERLIITEIPLDKYKMELETGMEPYFIRITEDGSIKKVSVNSYVRNFVLNDCQGFDTQNNFYVATFAKDENHAIEIAQQKLSEVLQKELNSK